MKYYRLKLYRRIPLKKLNQRLVYLIVVALFSLTSVLGIHNLFSEKTIAAKPSGELICPIKQNLSAEEFSRQGINSYNNGHFGEAIDCWQKAIAGYRKLNNKNETSNNQIINNQINIAQAQQALGFFPRACNTLLEVYDIEENCKTLLEKQVKGEKEKLVEKLREGVNSPSQITGLRLFGNILRELGELKLSHQVLSINKDKLEKSSPEEKAATWLDLGNTRRAFSNKEWDLYNRSREERNLVCTIIGAYEATQAYKEADGEITSNSTPAFNNIKLQSKLNQFSITLDLQDLRHDLRKQTKTQKDALKRLFFYNDSNVKLQNRLFLNKQTKDCWKKLEGDDTQYKFTNEISRWLKPQLLESNQPIQLSQINQHINELQKQINELPAETHTALFTRLNFAKNLIRMINDKDKILAPNLTPKIDKLLDTSITKAKELGDKKAESYGYGYLGELYEKRSKFKLAKENTEKALSIAQSTEIASQTQYLWEWQLGRIYKSQFTAETQAQTKEIKQKNSINLNTAREMYGLAYNTLQSLRAELVATNPDAQFSFQDDIEIVYRDYVNLLLWDINPDNYQEKEKQKQLGEGRQVIASLQAVQLENYLRVACPEYNLEEIDTIVDERTQNAAFIYPILLEDEDLGDRIEVILKLPGQQELKTYTKKITNDDIDTQNFKDFQDYIREFQKDLEEEYTFEQVKEKGKKVYEILLKEPVKIIEKYNKQQDKNKIDTLVFALDTNLRNIPLAALVVDDKKEQPLYLIDEYAVALAPSLEIPTPRIIQGKKLRVLAAALTEPDTEKYRAEFPQYLQNFGKLRYATTEIENLNSGKISVVELKDENFESNEFEKKVNNTSFQVLHLATHGQFSSSPEETFILAYNQPIFVNQLDNIFRRQALNLPEPVELIVLSACETAAGDRRATLGISGVAVRAGARSAIASLWTVDDKISVEFAQGLYNQLVQPELNKAQALQKAQIELKQSPGREHPRYWAPYVLLGNWL